MKRFLLLLLLFFFLTQPVGNVCAEFEDTGVSPRVIGMGNAFTGLCDDASSIYYNPAGLGFLPRKEFDCSGAKLHLGLDDDSDISNVYMGYVNPVNKIGTFGAGWLNTSLGGLYGENTFLVSFGKRLIKNREMKKTVSFGINLKLLVKSYTKNSDIEDSFNDNGVATGEADPVFNEGLSRAWFSCDMGVLYRLNRYYSVGISISDLNRPDTSFGEVTEGITTVPMKIRGGFAFRNRTRDFNVVADVFYRNNDLRLLAGVEKWFNLKTIAVRGGVGLGSRSYRNLTFGAGYRFGQLLEVDYSFIFPLSGLSSTLGSHRVALTTRFGSVVQDFREEYDAELSMIDAEVARRKHLMGLTMEEENKKKAGDYYLESKKLCKNGLYATSLRKLDIARILDPSDKVMEGFSQKLNRFVKIISMEIRIDKRGDLVRRGIVYYCNNDKKLAINIFQYLTEVYPEDDRITEVHKIVIRDFPDQARKEKLSEGINIVEQKLFRSLSYLYENKYDLAISESNEVLEIEKDNITAYMRLGSAYYLMGNTGRAKDAWKKVFELNPDNRELSRYLDKVDIFLERPVRKTDKEIAGEKLDIAMEYYKKIEKYLKTEDKIFFLKEVVSEFKALVDVAELNHIINQLKQVKEGPTYDEEKEKDKKIKDEAQKRLARMKKHYARAVALFGENKYEKAIKELRKILKLNATHKPSLNLIKKAEKMMSMSDEERSKVKMTQYYGTGLGYYQKGEWKKALVEFEKLLKITPGHSQSLRLIKKIKEKMNLKSTSAK